MKAFKSAILGVASLAAAMPSPSVSVGGDPYPSSAPRVVHRYYSRPPAAPPATGGDGLSDKVAAKCGCSSSNPLAGAADSMSHDAARDLYAAVRNGRQYVESFRASCRWHCRTSGDSDDRCIDFLVSKGICGMRAVGAAKFGNTICVIACDIDGGYDAPADPAPQPDTIDYQPPQQDYQPPPPPPQDDYQPPPPQDDYEPSPPPYSGGGGFGSQCLALTNQYRRSRGLPDLRPSATADRLCQQQSSCMASKGIMSHSACKDFGSRMRDGGAGMPAAENIADGYMTPESVVKGWIDSPGHEKNIRNPGVNACGCCIVGRYATQVFITEKGDY